ncbi:MAG: hypothetical protein HQK52_00890 [Oligoflexia bacterium]|nr:hypothetical protein [Oligoflexia bacterium]
MFNCLMLIALLLVLALVLFNSWFCDNSIKIKRYSLGLLGVSLLCIVVAFFLVSINAADLDPFVLNCQRQKAWCNYFFIGLVVNQETLRSLILLMAFFLLHIYQKHNDEKNLNKDINFFITMMALSFVIVATSNIILATVCIFCLGYCPNGRIISEHGIGGIEILSWKNIFDLNGLFFSMLLCCYFQTADFSIINQGFTAFHENQNFFRIIVFIIYVSVIGKLLVLVLSKEKESLDHIVFYILPVMYFLGKFNFELNFLQNFNFIMLKILALIIIIPMVVRVFKHKEMDCGFVKIMLLANICFALSCFVLSAFTMGKLYLECAIMVVLVMMFFESWKRKNAVQIESLRIIPVLLFFIPIIPLAPMYIMQLKIESIFLAQKEYLLFALSYVWTVLAIATVINLPAIMIETKEKWSLEILISKVVKASAESKKIKINIESILLLGAMILLAVIAGYWTFDTFPTSEGYTLWAFFLKAPLFITMSAVCIYGLDRSVGREWGRMVLVKASDLMEKIREVYLKIWAGISSAMGKQYILTSAMEQVWNKSMLLFPKMDILISSVDRMVFLLAVSISMMVVIVIISYFVS